MRIRSYPSRMADETPYMRQRYVRDEEGILQLQWVSYSLRMDKGLVFAPLDTLSGVQVLWRHGMSSFFGEGPDHAVGRVETMKIRDKALMGDIIIADELLGAFVTGGVEALDIGTNCGLSIGFNEIDRPEMTRGTGTFEDPHVVRFGRISVREVSLTPMPTLATAGVEFDKGADKGDPEQGMGGGHGPDREKERTSE